jgi:hypothetical protein
MKAIVEKYKYRFLLTKDECGDMVALGKLGQLYNFGPMEEYGKEIYLGALFMPPTEQKGWSARRKALIEAGGVLKQNGDLEGVVLIPAKDTKLVKLAARLMGVRTTREMTPEKKAELTDRLSAARKAKT